MILLLLEACALGSFLWLDRFQIFELMLSRPIVAAPLVGWAAGSMEAGLVIGILFELLWLAYPPIGGVIPPDGSFAAIAATVVTALVGSTTEIQPKTMGVLVFPLFLPVAYLGAFLDGQLRRYLYRLARDSEGGLCLAEPEFRGVFVKALFAGWLTAFVALTLLTAVTTVILIHAAPLLPKSLITAAAVGFYVAPLLVIIDYATLPDQRRSPALLVTGFTLSVVICLAAM